jgi:predicted DNA-binding transcriptional regulator AlpA
MSDRVRVDRICEITSLSRRQVQALAAQGKIPSAAQLGKVWTFREDIVQRWVRNKESRTWRGTSTSAAKSGGLGLRLPAGNIEEAYRRLLGPKRSRPFRPSAKGTADPDTQARG